MGSGLVVDLVGHLEMTENKYADVSLDYEDFDYHGCSCPNGNPPCSHCVECLYCSDYCMECDGEHDGPRNLDCPSLLKVSTMISQMTLTDTYNDAIKAGLTPGEALESVARLVAEDCAKIMKTAGKTGQPIRDEYELNSENPSGPPEAEIKVDNMSLPLVTWEESNPGSLKPLARTYSTTFTIPDGAMYKLLTGMDWNKPKDENDD